jgi:putative hydrolase of the HAD superfamily
MPQAPAYLLSDLDETLYPSSCGLMQAVSARMSLFVARYLKVGQEEAARIRRRLRVVYGTTLTGLMREPGLEVAEQYSPLEHAERILARLGVRRLFERVFDLRFNRFTGKPDPGVYRRALGELGRRAPEVLLVDNHLDYLAPFRAMGGQVLLIDEKGEAAGSGLRDGIPSLRDFKELPSFLASLSPPRPARH